MLWSPELPFTLLLCGLTPRLSGKESTCQVGDAGTKVWSRGQEDPLERERATHSSILAWEIPWTEEPGRLQSMGWHNNWTRLSSSTTARSFAGSTLSPVSHCPFWASCFEQASAQIYWLGQKVRLGFRTIVWGNPNEVFGQPNTISRKTYPVP